jgi:hypothetical protein
MPTARATARPTPPTAGEDVAAADAAQVGDEDADDERGFEAFAEADQEGGEHERFSGREVRLGEPHKQRAYTAASRPLNRRRACSRADAGAVSSALGVPVEEGVDLAVVDAGEGRAAAARTSACARGRSARPCPPSAP